MAASVSGEQALWVATVATRDLSHDPLLTFCCGHTLFNHFFSGSEWRQHLQRITSLYVVAFFCFDQLDIRE